MNYTDIAILVVIIGAYIYIKSKVVGASLKALDTEKAADTAKLAEVKAEVPTLKAKADAEQANATEQQKTDFWTKELDNDKKPN